MGATLGLLCARARAAKPFLASDEAFQKQKRPTLTIDQTMGCDHVSVHIQLDLPRNSEGLYFRRQGRGRLNGLAVKAACADSECWLQVKAARIRRIGSPGVACGAQCMMQLESTLTCPSCGDRSIETMPTDACVFFYDCKGCGTRLKPLAGDCCVFCSYGSVPCPPVQTNDSCCAPRAAEV